MVRRHQFLNFSPPMGLRVRVWYLKLKRPFFSFWISLVELSQRQYSVFGTPVQQNWDCRRKCHEDGLFPAVIFLTAQHLEWLSGEAKFLEETVLWHTTWHACWGLRQSYATKTSCCKSICRAFVSTSLRSSSGELTFVRVLHVRSYIS